MAYSRIAEKRLPADMAMEIVASCDGDLAAASAYLDAMARFLNALEPTGVPAADHLRPAARPSPPKGPWARWRFPTRKQKPEDPFLDFDMSGGLTGVLDCDYDLDETDTSYPVRSERPRFHRAA